MGFLNMKIRFLVVLMSVVLFQKSSIGQYGFHLESGAVLFSIPSENQHYMIKNTSHFGIGPSYWFRIKPRRIEFNPALLFDYTKSNELSNALSLKEIQFKLSIPILFYPMDFGNDCNCPTFNKQGQFFKKGFHFILNPNFAYNKQTYKTVTDPVTNSALIFSIGIGAGIDIGINRAWTFSPSFVLNKSFNDEFLLKDTGLIEKDLSLSRYQANLQLRFLWYPRKKRY